MSTKIYNGCRLDCTAETMIDHLRPIRKNIRKYAANRVTNAACDMIAEFCCTVSQHTDSMSHILDIISDFLPETIPPEDFTKILRAVETNAPNLFHLICYAWNKAYLEHPMNEFQYKGFDASFELFLFPKGQTVYCLPSSCDELILCFLNQPGIISFEYCDNTDKPDDISEKEWTHRRDTWTTLLNRNLEENSVVYTILHPDRTFIKHCMPKPERINQRLTDVRSQLAKTFTILQIQSEMEENGKISFANPMKTTQHRNMLMQKLNAGDPRLVIRYNQILGKMPKTFDECKRMFEEISKR